MLRKYILVVLTILCFLPQQKGFSQWMSTKFIVLSHVYYTWREPDVFDKLIEAINEEEAEYVFFLGDIVFENTPSEWEYVLDKFSKINKEIYYTAGNHDIYKFRHVEQHHNLDSFPQWLNEYKENRGSGYHLVEDNQANFVMINTIDYFDNISAYLKSISNVTSKRNKPNILMGHHVLWSPDQLFGYRSWAHKRFSWQQIKPYLANYDHIFCGDLWNQFTIVDLGAGKKGYYCGIGTMGRPVFYVACEINNGYLSTRQKVIDLPPDHPYIQKGRHHSYNCEQFIIRDQFKEED